MMREEANYGRGGRWAIWCAVAIFGVLALAAGVTSEGFIEADACSHYQFSRFCFTEHHLLVNVWGRPFCTLIYALPAVVGGRVGTVVFGIAMAMFVGWICYVIARKQGYGHPALAMIFLLGQPMVFLHSFSVLTELPFVMLLSVALWAYQGRRFALMAIVVGLMPTARPEGFGFALVAIVGLVAHRRWWWAPLVLLPVCAWSYWGWWLYGKQEAAWWQWLPGHWPYVGDSMYDRGSPLHFVAFLPGIVGPFFFPAVVVGGWLTLRWRGMARLLADHGYRVELVIATAPIAVVLVHSYLHWRGKMSSSGELRYMMVVAPMWAMLAARGWEFVFERMEWRSIYRAAGVACMVAALANGAWKLVPFKLNKEGMRSKEVAKWIEQTELLRTHPRMMLTPQGITVQLDLNPWDRERCVGLHRRVVERANSVDYWGVLLVWDPVYGLYNSSSELSVSARELRDAGWVPVHTWERQPGDAPGGAAATGLTKRFDKDSLKPWVVFLSPMDKDGNPTPRDREVRVPEEVLVLKSAVESGKQ